VGGGLGGFSSDWQQARMVGDKCILLIDRQIGLFSGIPPAKRRKQKSENATLDT
jgi:hypothetical protein